MNVRLCDFSVLRMSRPAAARQVGLASDKLIIRAAYLQMNTVTYRLPGLTATMSFSKAEYHKEDFIAGMPPVPEGEFCVFGTVGSFNTSDYLYL